MAMWTCLAPSGRSPLVFEALASLSAVTRWLFGYFGLLIRSMRSQSCHMGPSVTEASRSEVYPMARQDKQLCPPSSWIEYLLLVKPTNRYPVISFLS